jgi:SAM-dependent methyltransferase
MPQAGPGEPREYHDGMNEQLLAVVPESASVIVELGCANGRLGAALKRDRPDRRVVGVERHREAAAVARTVLDEVHELDLERELPAIEPGSVDCVVLGDVIEHLTDPLPLLRAARTWLAPTGLLACSIPNLAHHSVLVQLLRGDLQYEPAGILDETHVRFYTYATIMKLLLEAGFAPTIADIIEIRGRDHVIEAAKPLLEVIGVDAPQAARHLNAYQYIATGRPIAYAEGPVRPLTFVACTNDEAQLHHNLLASPCLGPGAPHQVLLYEGMSSAAEGLNRGIREAEHDIVVLLHQDVYLPSWWPAQLGAQWDLAQQSGTVALAGAFGVRYREGGRTNVGHVVDRDQLLATDEPLPTTVDGIDEMLMIVPRDTPLRFDPALGWHLYGTDLALEAHARGLRTVILDVPCHHNSLLGGLDDSYGHSESVLARKWSGELPIVTNSSTIDRDPLAEQVAALRADLEAAQQDLARQVEATEAADQQLAARDELIAAMEASKAWRARSLLNRARGRRR